MGQWDHSGRTATKALEEAIYDFERENLAVFGDVPLQSGVRSD